MLTFLFEHFVEIVHIDAHLENSTSSKDQVDEKYLTLSHLVLSCGVSTGSCISDDILDGMEVDL